MMENNFKAINRIMNDSTLEAYPGELFRYRLNRLDDREEIVIFLKIAQKPDFFTESVQFYCVEKNQIYYQKISHFNKCYVRIDSKGGWY
ncbi:MAG: hypothetical protein AABY22_05525 [Nanoarchaeota archaeon]